MFNVTIKDIKEVMANNNIFMLNIVTTPFLSILRVGIRRTAKNAENIVAANTEMLIMLNEFSVFGNKRPPIMDMMTVNKNAVSAKNIGVLTNHCLSVVC